VDYRPVLRNVLGAAAIVLLASGCTGNAVPGNTTIDLGAAVHGNAASAAETSGTAPNPGAAAAQTSAAEAPASAGGAATAVPGPVLTNGQERNVVLDGQEVELRCDGGGSIDIEANDVVLVVTGHCQDIEVLGFGITLDAELLDKLDVPGNANTITVAEAATLKVEGSDNRIEAGAVGEIDAEGAGNSVSYRAGSPEVEDEGSGNSISTG